MIDDTEWIQFYEHVIEPFQKCDKDKNNSLNEEEVKACFSGKVFLNSDPEGPFKNINEIWKEEESTKHFMFIMMHPGLNLYDYVYMRRFNNAMNSCNENEKVMPVKYINLKE